MSVIEPGRATRTTSPWAISGPAPDPASPSDGAESFNLAEPTAKTSSTAVPYEQAASPDRGELVDVVVRLPRKAIEETLLSAPVCGITLADRRLADARAVLTSRRQRTTCFGRVRFDDPSWEMILALYVATRESRNLFVSQLCDLSGGSTTTALRHIDHIEALGYIRREMDVTDRRRANVVMLPALMTAVERWLDLQRTAMRIGC